jgi:hypothetical protein
MINLYNDIKTIISTKIVEIKHIDLFRNQFQQIESGSNEMKTFAFPCIFISFEDGINYTSNTAGILNGVINVKIYIGFEKLTEAFEVISNIAKKVQANIHNISGIDYDNLTKTNEQYEINHSNIYVWSINFNANYQDKSYLDLASLNDLLVNPVTPEIPTTWNI